MTGLWNDLAQCSTFARVQALKQRRRGMEDLHTMLAQPKPIWPGRSAKQVSKTAVVPCQRQLDFGLEPTQQAGMLGKPLNRVLSKLSSF